MVIVCQCCERLFVSNGLWRWSLWLCALSSWRRLDSWGVETGEICEIFHRQKHTKFVRDMISAGLFPLTADEETLHRTVEEQRKSGTSSANPREEQMRLKEKTPMITQTLLAMTKDGIGLNRLSAGRAATDSGGNDTMEKAADSDAKSPEAEWRTLSKPSAAMARKVAAFEKSATGFKLPPEQLSACRWFAEAMDVALQEDAGALAKPHAACMSFDWRGRHWKDYYHFRTHAGCFLSFFSGQTWRRRATHDFHL